MCTCTVQSSDAGWGCLGINVPRFQSLLFASPFLPRDAMLKRYLLSSCVRLSVCPSVRHKLRFYRNDWTNRAGFWHGGFLPPVLHRVPRMFVYLQKLVQCTVHCAPKKRQQRRLFSPPGCSKQASGLYVLLLFLIYYFHDSCHTHYLKICRTDLRYIFRIDRIMAAECR